MRRTLYIVRGLPGSGKSTLGAQIAAQKRCPYVEVDMYMSDSKGNYAFNKNKLKTAQRWCKKQAVEALKLQGAVVISNTSATLRTLLPYFMIAYRFRAMIIIKEPNTPWRWDVEECERRNKHNVNIDTIRKYKSQWFPIKPVAYSYRDMWHGELLPLKSEKEFG